MTLDTCCEVRDASLRLQAAFMCPVTVKTSGMYKRTVFGWMMFQTPIITLLLLTRCKRLTILPIPVRGCCALCDGNCRGDWWRVYRVLAGCVDWSECSFHVVCKAVAVGGDTD